MLYLNKRLIAFTTLVACLVSSQVRADLFDLNWELRREADGIQVYTASVPDSKFKAVQAQTTMQTTVNQLVALVQDAAACAEWADLCKQAQLLETTSDTEMYVYTLNDLPWPVTDREAVAHVAWAYQPDTETVTMRATVTDAMDAPDDMKKKKNTVRLTYGVTQWTFIPAADGKVEVISHAHVDPGGATPAWLTNRLLTDSPVKTLQRMRDIVTTDRYKGDEFAFMQAADSEPANTQTATPVE